MARHRVADDALLLGWLGAESDQARRAVSQGASGFPLDRRVDAAAAHPAYWPPLAKQQGAVAGPGRRRPHAADDGGQDEWPTLTAQLRRALQEIAGRRAVHTPAPLSWRMRHRRGGVMGISTWV